MPDKGKVNMTCFEIRKKERKKEGKYFGVRETHQQLSIVFTNVFSDSLLCFISVGLKKTVVLGFVELAVACTVGCCSSSKSCDHL